MSNHTNNIGEALNHVHHDEVMSEGKEDCYKSTPHIALEESHIPLPVKKVVDLNGMSLQTNCEKSISLSESEPQERESSSSENVDEDNQTEKLLPDPVDSLRTSSSEEEIEYVGYESELQMGAIMALITKDLSEPYSIYTYRYFIHNWPNLCFLVRTSLRWSFII
jgi:hypothetical protein